mgnify:CR=1 FL=1
MKSVVLDTHALVWFLQKNKNLSKKALHLILSNDNLKVIPLIVLCEVHYLHARGRFNLSAGETVARVTDLDDFEIVSHSQEQIPHLLSSLDIHDALIVAVALTRQEKDQSEVVIISKDDQIRKHSPLPVIWDDS